MKSVPRLLGLMNGTLLYLSSFMITFLVVRYVLDLSLPFTPIMLVITNRFLQIKRMVLSEGLIYIYK